MVLNKTAITTHTEYLLRTHIVLIAWLHIINQPFLSVIIPRQIKTFVCVVINRRDSLNVCGTQTNNV